MLAGKNGVRQITLGLLQGKNSFFNGILNDQAVNSDLILLPDTVRTVCGLILRRQIPPRVIVDHHVRAGQVQSRSACFQRDQEYRRIAVIELPYQFCALFGRLPKIVQEYLGVEFIDRVLP